MGFKKISIQEELIAKVEHYIETSKQYRSIAEFVSEAIRLRLEQLEKTANFDQIKESAVQ